MDEHAVHKVPNPFPLTLAGMMAALGPQAINFGISIGGGEAFGGSGWGRGSRVAVRNVSALIRPRESEPAP